MSIPRPVLPKKHASSPAAIQSLSNNTYSAIEHAARANITNNTGAEAEARVRSEAMPEAESVRLSRGSVVFMRYGLA